MRVLSASEAKPIGEPPSVATSVSPPPSRAPNSSCIGRGHPRLLLRLAVIVGGQFLDAGAEYLRQQRHILRQHRPHREFRLRLGGHDSFLQTHSFVMPALVAGIHAFASST